MKKFTLALVLSACLAGALAPLAHAANVPCEEMLKQLRDKETTATVADADKASYDDLKAKGIERCNADDDKRADDFFTQAMALFGK